MAQAFKTKGAAEAAASAIAGSLPLKGANGTCTVAIQGRHTESGVECEAIVVSFANGEKIEVPIVSSAAPAGAAGP